MSSVTSAKIRVALDLRIGCGSQLDVLRHVARTPEVMLNGRRAAAVVGIGEQGEAIS